MKLSIIVPIYNMEKYLERCIESLIVQDVEDMEILLINDGSTDGSKNIINRYTEKYSFVKGYEKPNGGLSDARNYGIEKAAGEYIAFVDSDDYVAQNMYKTMLKKAYRQNYDIVVCDFEEIYPDHVRRGSSRIEKDLVSRESVKKHMCDIYPSAWNKIYRRGLFSDVKFKKNVWFEDVEMLYRILPLVGSIGTVHQPFYKYVQREGSISNSKDPRIFHYIDNWNGILDFYKSSGIFQEYYKELEYSYVRYLFATFIMSALKFNRKMYDKAVRDAIVNVRKNFPGYRKNVYFYKSLKGLYLLGFNRCIAWVLYFFKSQK